jgi:1-deoxy-D-xylulose-5-phosphate reductoisomerase
MLELIEAQKLFKISSNKIDILIHPNSLIHAIVKLKNGLSKFIYHETTMIVPIANAIFENNFDIKNFYNKGKREIFENLEFRKVDEKIFPVFKIKNRLTELPSTPIIVNASNEVLVAHFLKKKIPFQAIFKIIMTILDDRNYKKYAIRKPKNINQINKIDFWAKQKTKEKITALYD